MSEENNNSNENLVVMNITYSQLIEGKIKFQSGKNYKLVIKSDTVNFSE